MAKIKPIYLIGAAALAAYLFKDKLFGKSAAAKEITDSEIEPAEAAKPDAVIDTTKTGQTVTQAVEAAKQIAQGVKDIKVLIKTPAGQKDVTVTSGYKKPLHKKRKKKKKTTTPGFDMTKWATNPLNPASALVP